MTVEVELDRLEFAVLARRATPRYIPTIASHGHRERPIHDIAAELAAAEQRCRDRGLLEPSGRVHDDMWDLLGTYTSTITEFDLRFATGRAAELRVAVSVANQVAVRLVVDGERCTLTSVEPQDAVSALTAALPERGPVSLPRPLSVDAIELRGVLDELPEDAESAAVRGKLNARGADVADYPAIVRLLDTPRLGAGEIGVTVWDARRRAWRADRTVKVVDVAAGRLTIHTSGNRRLLSGANTTTLDRILTEIATFSRDEIV